MTKLYECRFEMTVYVAADDDSDACDEAYEAIRDELSRYDVDVREITDAKRVYGDDDEEAYGAGGTLAEWRVALAAGTTPDAMRKTALEGHTRARPATLADLPRWLAEHPRIRDAYALRCVVVGDRGVLVSDGTAALLVHNAAVVRDTPWHGEPWSADLLAEAFDHNGARATVRADALREWVSGGPLAAVRRTTVDTALVTLWVMSAIDATGAELVEVVAPDIDMRQSMIVRGDGWTAAVMPRRDTGGAELPAEWTDAQS